MQKKAIFIFLILAVLIFLQKRFAGKSDCEMQIDYSTVDLNDHLNWDTVFAPVTELEKQAVLDDWENMDLIPRSVVHLGQSSLLGGSHLHTVSHEVEGNVHYGAILTPPGLNENTRYPVLIFAAGLDQYHPEVSLKHSALQYLSRELGNEYIILVPSFRGQALKHTMYTYCSEGFFGDAFDGAASDAIALLNVALTLYPAADSSRVAICGASRGGTVSLLAGIRDKRVKKVLALASPTDFLKKRQLGWQFRYQFLSREFSLPDIRKNIIKSSPIHFAEKLPQLWLEQGEKDRIVWKGELENLLDTLRARNYAGSPVVHFRKDYGHDLPLRDDHIRWLKDWE